MKVLLLATSYPRSKQDHWVTFTHSWAKELARSKDVAVVTSDGPDARKFEERDNVKIHRFTYFYPRKLQRLTYTGGMSESFKGGFLPKIQVPFFLISFFFKSLRHARKCDIINAHWTLSGLVAIPLKWICKKPVVLTEHGGGIRYLPKWLNKFVLKRMDAITSAHNDMIDAVRNMGISNVFEVRNFLNEDRFLKKHDVKSIKREFEIRDEKVVSFIGRFEELKGPLTFVRAIPYAAKKNNGIKFIMVGDGHLKDEIKKEIKRLGIKKYIIMPGAMSEVERVFAISDIFVACSAIENCFSTTILEAMLSKVPCIITKAGMTEKYFTHGKYAYLVERKNPEELGNAIADLLADNKLRKTLSENEMEFLEKNGFRNKVIMERIMNVFDNLFLNPP